MTEHQHLEAHDHQAGDKVLIRAGSYKGTRGIIVSEQGGFLVVQMGSDGTVDIAYHDVTNFSRAARRAWQNMPKRAGRPKSSKPQKKMVSMRMDPIVWERLGIAVERGLIPSREQAVNDWIQEHLDILLKDSL